MNVHAELLSGKPPAELQGLILYNRSIFFFNKIDAMQRSAYLGHRGFTALSLGRKNEGDHRDDAMDLCREKAHESILPKLR